ncbi:MAG: complex I NDUFA9 subunit family protein [Gammaproteobacteria bacterium]|nr:complex I NDUFA9 subunit family protein [Gammaproteobacteria bacterium]
MSNLKICLLGGAGFVGRSITSRLTNRGHQAIILTRHRERQRDLLVEPLITLVEGDVHDVEFLARQFREVDVVINLIGILNERGHRGKGFHSAHVALAEKVVEAVTRNRNPQLLHMSALNASRDGASYYLRTKGLAEDLVHERAGEAGYRVTSFRPSVIFGARDSFTNRFASLLRTIPAVFPLACPEARFQPVHIDDVARVFVQAIDDPDSHGERVDLCGPTVYTLRQLVTYLDTEIGTRHRIIGLSDWQSRLQAMIMEWVPGKPFSLDNYRSLLVDSVCESSDWARFGFSPAHLESIAPRYLRAR